MKYNVIYMDPPWKYARKADGKITGGACVHYPLMPLSEIQALPIPELAAENCALLMWCTFPLLEDQIKLFKHWGFEYKTIAFNWVKTNPKGGIFFGIGYYSKSNTEICLLGIKGRMKPASNRVSSVIVSPRREHSRKPDIIRKKIVELFGDVPRIELFARQPTSGWAVWGNETEKFAANELQLFAS